MLRTVEHPGRHGPPLTPDGRQRAAKQRERVLDARQRAAERREQEADQRDARADQRDADADERDAKADQRDARADERDRLADQRDAKADQRDRELLRDSATARLHAQLESMPVIEQAKGVIMEQTGCTAEQAFDLLRKASQRSNVPVRELAARIVGRRHLPKPGPCPHDPRSQHPAP
jgi:ANTAR domain